MDVEFDRVAFGYRPGSPVLRDVSVLIPAGSRVAVVGHTGAGKTTFVRQLNGLLAPTSGTVSVGGQATAGRTVAELSRRVGYLFQNPDEQLFARTIAADVGFGPKNLGFPPERARSAVSAALERTGLADLAGEHPLELPPARRRMVALASVLAMETPVLVLDEPTTGQDGRGCRLIADIIASLAEEGRTVVTICHDLDFVAENFDRVLVLDRGRLRADGPPGLVFADNEVMAAAGLVPPQLVRLGIALGWGDSPEGLPVTVPAALEHLRRAGGTDGPTTA